MLYDLHVEIALINLELMKSEANILRKKSLLSLFAFCHIEDHFGLMIMAFQKPHDLIAKRWPIETTKQLGFICTWTRLTNPLVNGFPKLVS